jgi:hypothetical protein
MSRPFLLTGARMAGQLGQVDQARRIAAVALKRMPLVATIFCQGSWPHS